MLKRIYLNVNKTVALSLLSLLTANISVLMVMMML